MIADFFKTTLGKLRLVGIAEGISFLILLFIAMPLKYGAGMPEAVRIVGTAHGILFVLFLLYLLSCKIERDWPMRKAMALVGWSMLPFGNFYADAKILKPEQAAEG